MSVVETCYAGPMNKYIIVRVSDQRSAGRHTSDLALIRKAIHRVSEELGIPVADMVTDSEYMESEESGIISKIFEGALGRVKYNLWLRQSFASLK